MIVGTKIFIRAKDKYLLLKRDSVESYKGWWDIPGGKIEKNESIECCAIREVKEETNLNLNIDDLMYLKSFNVPYKSGIDRFVMIVYLSNIEKIDNITLSEEHSELAWIEKNKLFEYLESYQEIFDVKGLIENHL